MCGLTESPGRGAVLEQVESLMRTERPLSSQIGRRNLIQAGAAGLILGSPPASVFAQSGAQAPDAPQTEAASVASHRAEVPMPHAGVAAGHPLASLAGTRMLLAGGRHGGPERRVAVGVERRRQRVCDLFGRQDGEGDFHGVYRRRPCPPGSRR